MKKLISFCMIIWSCASNSADTDSVTVQPQRSLIATSVFYQEVLRIPFRFTWSGTTRIRPLLWPPGSRIEYASNGCPGVPRPHPESVYTCVINVVIPGDVLGKIIAGSLLLSYSQPSMYSRAGSGYIALEPFSVTVVPHHLAMLPGTLQQATANQEFTYSLKSLVKYYDENALAGKPAQVLVSPIEKEGLRFDPVSRSIIGKPQHTGTQTFKVSAQNVNGTTDAIDFTVNVNANPKDKPSFKTTYSMNSALPSQPYSMNLMELVQPKNGFMVSNQIVFHIQKNENNPDWLAISSKDATRLEGLAPEYLAGKQVTISLIATSNTGGDSEPLLVSIPIAYDPTKKPVVDYFELEGAADEDFYQDLSAYINDPAHDANLKVVLDKVEPLAPWLGISALNPTQLEGHIPPQATGQKYQVSLRVSTAIGGSSEPIIIPLQIGVDKTFTPRFKNDNPLLPLVYPGQAFFYDFVANADVYPEFDDEPYVIEFAKNHSHPSWLKIENNQLIADEVPELNEYKIELSIIIKNRAGGSSDVITLALLTAIN
ncbi:MAG: hypothetical protein ACHP65_02330 [Legionellales bacterium]